MLVLSLVLISGVSFAALLKSSAFKAMFFPTRKEQSGLWHGLRLVSWISLVTFMYTGIQISQAYQSRKEGNFGVPAVASLHLMLCFASITYLIGFFSVISVTEGDEKSTSTAALSHSILGSSSLLSNQDSILSSSRVAARMDGYDSLYKGAREDVGKITTDESILLRQKEYKLMVDSFYDLVTDFYQYGWGQSFHFANRYLNETFQESIKRVEYYLAMKLNINSSSHCLDMGCGVAGPLRNIAKFSGAKITGITLNEYQVRVGNKRIQEEGLVNCGVKQGDFMNMPFPDNTFDGAYAIEATCHAPNKVKCFSEALRVLKPGGKYAVLEWAMVKSYDAKNKEHVELREGIEVGNGLPTIEVPDQIIKALKEAGFEIEEHYDINQNVHSDVEFPWYDTLYGKMTLQGFRMTKLGRMCTHLLVSALELIKIAPKGSVRVSKMLNQTADDLVKAGQLEIFTPSYFLLARKPLKPIKSN